MRDPFPIPPPRALVEIAKPFVVDTLGFSTLPFHIHEILLSTAFYTWVHLFVSPLLSRWLFPKAYSSFSRRTRVNWDIHAVSLVQSLIICAVAIYILVCDPARVDALWADRVWGYSGLVGLCQSMAGGYFLWDLFVTVRYFDIFGVGMLIHALSALFLSSFGFLPIFNYYGPAFILYELSSPFNNIHWFLDKLSLTGSTYQWVNGIVLIATFFFCRLVWGFFYTGLLVYDIWNMYTHGFLAWSLSPSEQPGAIVREANTKFEYSARYVAGQSSFSAWEARESISVYLAAAFVLANLALNALNVYWIGKMVDTVRRRFPPPFGSKVDRQTTGEIKTASGRGSGFAAEAEDKKDL